MAKAKIKSVAKKGTSELSTNVMDMKADQNIGIGNADSDSYAIPFLQALQALSPQMDDDNISGTKPGMMINTITNELYDVGEKGKSECLFIPAAYKRSFLQWEKDRGGFKGEHDPAKVIAGEIEGLVKDQNGFYQIETKTGLDDLQDTRMHYGLVQTKSGSWIPAIVSLSSTQIKKSKRLMSLIQGLEMEDSEGNKFTPPMFSHMYTIKTVKESNTQGSWHGISFMVNRPLNEDEVDVYMKARKLALDVGTGAATASTPDVETDKL